jgi:hypothetical protein
LANVHLLLSDVLGDFLLRAWAVRLSPCCHYPRKSCGYGRAHRLAAYYTAQSALAHQALDRAACDGHAFTMQLSPDLVGPVQRNA